MKPLKSQPVAPVTPGYVLRERFLKPLGITQDHLAKAMRVSRFSVNQIINGHRSITADMALRLAHVMSTTPKFWLRLQREADLFRAKGSLSRTLPKLTVLRQPKSESELFQDVPERRQNVGSPR